MKDNHQNDIVFGRPYRLAVCAPGPDVSLVIPLSELNGKVIYFDLDYQNKGECNPESLFQRYKFKWEENEISLVKKFGGDWKFMEQHNSDVDASTPESNPYKKHIMDLARQGKPDKPLTKYKVGDALVCTFSKSEEEYSAGRIYTVSALDSEGWPRITNTQGITPDTGIDPRTSQVWTFQHVEEIYPGYMPRKNDD